MKHLIRTNGKIDALINKMNEIKNSEAEIKLLDAKIDHLENEIDDLTNEENPWADFIAEKISKLKNVKNALESDTKALETCQANLAAVQFWVKGFRRVRLFIIEQAFKTLEIEI